MKTLKVTFIYFDIFARIPDFKGAFYTGVASLAASLKKKGHDCELIHLYDPTPDREVFVSRVLATKPDLIAFSSTTHMFPMVSLTAGWLADAKVNIPVIVGGVHAILNPGSVLNARGVDFVCLGEGEQMLVDLCDALIVGTDLSEVLGLGRRQGGQIVLNPLSRYIADLDELPLPDRSIFDVSSLYGERDGVAPILASRGCPYRCTYCCNEALRRAKGDGKPIIRFHSVDYVIREAQQILQDYPFINKLVFDDDILFIDPIWAEEFAERFPKEVGITFSSNLRPNLATDATVALLKKAGCVDVKLGLESGNDYIRNRVLDRKLTRRHITDAASRCQKAGLSVLTFNMVGLPFETPRTVLDTIKLNAEIGPERVQYSTFYPFPGTKLYDKCVEHNFISDRKNLDFFSESILNQPSISKRQVKMFQRWFKQLVYIYRIELRLPLGLDKPAQAITTAILASKAGNILIDTLVAVIRQIYHVLKFIGGRSSKRYIHGDVLKTEQSVDSAKDC